MEENSRNLLNAFENDWKNVSNNISYWMYLKRICFLLYNFSTIIISLPFVFILSSDIMMNWWLNKCVLSFENSGVVFIKFGQWISCRPDLFGNDICESMRKLTNSVKTHNMKHNKEIIKKRFGLEINELFESFDERIYKTSGSIAQVHKATLHSNIIKENNLSFNRVAVKIRHPIANDIQQIALDLNIIFSISNIFKFIGNNIIKYGFYFTIPISYNEFEEIISRQCDLRYEAGNMIKFEINNMDNSNIIFPKIISIFCDNDIIIESWEDGENLSDIFNKYQYKNNKSIMSLNWAIDLGLQIFTKMLFKDRLIHCDMHSGNILINKNKNKIIILDGGLTVNPTESDIKLFVELLIDSLVGLPHNAANIILSLDQQYKDFINLNQIQNEYKLLQTLNDINNPQFQNKMYQYIENKLPSKVLSDKAILLHKDLVEMFNKNETYLQFKKKYNSDKRNWENLNCDKFYELGVLINNLVVIVQRNGIRLRSDFCALMLSIGVMEGLCKRINPNQDLIERCWPFIDSVNGFDRIESKFQSLGGRQYLLHQFGFL